MANPAEWIPAKQILGFGEHPMLCQGFLLSLVILKEVLLLLSLCWHPPVLHLSSLLMLQLVPVLPGVSDQPGINRGALASIILSLMLRALVLLIVTVTSAGIWEALT